VNKWETLILLTTMIVSMCVLWTAVYYARSRAIEDQQLEELERTTYNTERARNHYGIPCADKECECANNK